MKQFLRLTPAPGALLLAGIALLGKAGFAQSFFLGFEENGNFICGESGPTEATIHCTLSGSQGFSGAEGWAIGLKSSGHRFLDLTVSGTAAEAALSGGFVFNELTRGEGNEGAVSLVAL